MKSHLHLSICPFCGHANELASAAFDPDARPEDGDYSICFQCTRVAVFDSSVTGGSRKPNMVELTDITASPEIFHAVQTLKELKKRGYTDRKGREGVQTGTKTPDN